MFAGKPVSVTPTGPGYAPTSCSRCSRGDLNPHVAPMHSMGVHAVHASVSASGRSTLDPGTHHNRDRDRRSIYATVDSSVVVTG
jgi:hypothetical protein